MKKKLLVWSTFALALVATVGMAMPAKNAPEMITIKEAQAKKPAVEFPHKKHMEVVKDCATCHHTQEGLKAGADMDVKACSACHLDPEKADTPSMRQMSLKKNPMHIRCIDCHKQENKGPTKCNECHVKK